MAKFYEWLKSWIHRAREVSDYHSLSMHQGMLEGKVKSR